MTAPDDPNQHGAWDGPRDRRLETDITPDEQTLIFPASSWDEPDHEGIWPPLPGFDDGPESSADKPDTAEDEPEPDLTAEADTFTNESDISAEAGGVPGTVAAPFDDEPLVEDIWNGTARHQAKQIAAKQAEPDRADLGWAEAEPAAPERAGLGWAEAELAAPERADRGRAEAEPADAERAEPQRENAERTESERTESEWARAEWAGSGAGPRDTLIGFSSSFREPETSWEHLTSWAAQDYATQEYPLPDYKATDQMIYSEPPPEPAAEPVPQPGTLDLEPLAQPALQTEPDTRHALDLHDAPAPSTWSAPGYASHVTAWGTPVTYAAEAVDGLDRNDAPPEPARGAGGEPLGQPLTGARESMGEGPLGRSSSTSGGRAEGAWEPLEGTGGGRAEGKGGEPPEGTDGEPLGQSSSTGAGPAEGAGEGPPEGAGGGSREEEPEGAGGGSRGEEPEVTGGGSRGEEPEVPPRGGAGGQPPYAGPPPPFQPPPTPPTWPQQPPQAQQPGGGLGTASMVLGIASLVLLFVCGLGTLTAIVGVVLGVVALVKDSNRIRAIVGIVLSILTLILAMILAVVLFNWYQGKNFGECFDPALHPTQESAQRCVERKLNGVEPGVVKQLDMD